MSPSASPAHEEVVVETMETQASPQPQIFQATAPVVATTTTTTTVAFDSDAEAITTEEIQKTIAHPGSVRINVEGAFIVESQPNSPTQKPVNSGRISPSHETSDIRLPNHTAVVSHVAIDVSSLPLLTPFFSPPPGRGAPTLRLRVLPCAGMRASCDCETSWRCLVLTRK